MISTFAQVRTRVANLLDDPNQVVFSDAIILPAIQEAIDARQSALIFYEIPNSKVVVTYTVPAGTTTVTPLTMGILDLGEIIELRERRSGSTDRYNHVYECDDLPQRPQVEILGDWEWRGNAFWFVGATRDVQIWLSYFTSAEAPAALNTTPTGLDGEMSFLSLYAAAVAGPRKGYDELAAGYMKRAVGSRYDEGLIGGALFYLCQPMVRGRQRVQVAPRPYSVIRRRLMPGRGVYVAAQGGGSGVGTPNQYSTAAGTITGTLDGVNAVFLMLITARLATVYRNGLLMTQPGDVVVTGNALTFQPGQIPQPGDIITVEVWP